MIAAAYARYSTTNQTENSIEYQLDKIREYCTTKNIRIVRTFADRGKSGTNTFARDGFREMIEAARRREFDAVVIYDISRGSRDVVDWFTFREAMMRAGVKVISTQDRLGDYLNPSDFITESITVSLGQHQVLSSRAKSIDGKATKAQHGLFLGGFAPLGYDIVNQEYVINAREAGTVRKIFEWYSTGKSYNYIISHLEGEVGKRGRPIGKNSLRSILTNERYIGTYIWNEHINRIMCRWAGGKINPDSVRIEGRIPAIIDKETWRRVQNRMANSKRNMAGKAKRNYLLSGLIECSSCGATYVGHTSRNTKGHETSCYVCGNRYRTKTCQSSNVNAREVESFVIEHVREYLKDTAHFETYARELCNAVNNATADVSTEKRELAEVEAKIANGIKSIVSGFTFPELQDEIDRLRTRKSELEEVICAAQKNIKLAPEDIVRKLKQAAEDIGDPSKLKEVIQMVVIKIYAQPDGSFSVLLGVHMDGSPGRVPIICTTFIFIPSRRFR